MTNNAIALMVFGFMALLAVVAMYGKAKDALGYRRGLSDQREAFARVQKMREEHEDQVIDDFNGRVHTDRELRPASEDANNRDNT